jgi:hypothetical protein
MTTAKQEEVDMQWETPSYIDVSMNAEIGAYQDDFGEMNPGRASDPQALHTGLPENQSGGVEMQAVPA